MKIDLDKLVDEIMEEIPEYTIPRAYVRSIAEENIDCFDTRSEVLAETKMQLTEESGMEFMLTRREAEDYLCDEFSDDKWAGISEDSKISSRIVKAMEDDEDSTLFELLKSMPLIPAAKLIGGMIMKNMEEHGVSLSEEEAEKLCVSVIEDLNTSLGELNGDFDDDEDDGDEDIFGDMGITFEEEDEAPENTGKLISDDMTISRGRRSRITRFPGKK